MAGMTTTRPILAAFADIDAAESTLDWIGVDFVEAGEGFAGVLTDDDLELLGATLADPDLPGPVRTLAAALLDRLASGTRPATWRVTFGG
jgi:hypothetical protein